MLAVEPILHVTLRAFGFRICLKGICVETLLRLTTEMNEGFVNYSAFPGSTLDSIQWINKAHYPFV